ncbi:MAG: glycosyltransferase [Sphingorhabdus sp.]
MTIIHISTDYPDSFNPDKTSAIKNLLDATASKHDHFVYSLNRTDISPIKVGLGKLLPSRVAGKIESLSDNPKMISLSYEAPSRGIFLKSSMIALADHIAGDIARRNLRPKLVQGHKISMEGIIAYHVAQKLGIPYALSIQGNSDRSILNVRRDLWPLYRRIFHEAAVVFPFTPWALAYLEQRFGKRKGETVLLPCITRQDKILAPAMAENRIVSAFNLKHWRLKNLPALIRGADYVAGKVDDFSLDIFGGGDAADVAIVQSWAASADHATIRLPGAVASAQIQREMNKAAGFTMVSHKESYGMVFVEALLAGCPVVYPANAAIDGYFDDHDFAIPVPAKNQTAINEAMLRLLRDQQQLKSALARWQQSGEAAFFQKRQIAASYAKGLKAAIGRGK